MTGKFSKYLAIVVFLFIILIIRMIYGFDVPLSGDEGGVTLLQATGQWEDYNNHLICGRPVNMEEIRSFVRYTEKYTFWDVIQILRKDRLHPPFYFVLLHFYMGLFGSTILSIRLFSAILSVLSVFAMYLLGKTIYNESVGGISAFFVSISPYCLEYSIIVRPYPLLTLLAILSTYQVVKLVKTGGFKFKQPQLYLYILTSAAGLYTFYSYFFVIACQFLFVFFNTPKKVHNQIKVVFTFFLILILFIPWIQPLIAGVKFSQEKYDYYKGTYTFFFFINQVGEFLFFPYQRGFNAESGMVMKMVIPIFSVLILLVFLWGTRRSFSNEFVPSFCLAVLLYFILTYLNDKILTTRSLVIEKQQYFIVPILLLLVAASLYFFSQKSAIRILLFSLFTLLLVIGSVYRFRHKGYFDGPYYFRPLTERIIETSSNDKDNEILILYNTNQKRFLLPFVIDLDREIQIMVLPNGNDFTTLDKARLQQYRKILVINITVPTVKVERLKWVKFNVDELNDYLERIGFINTNAPFIFTENTKATLLTYEKPK